MSTLLYNAPAHISGVARADSSRYSVIQTSIYQENAVDYLEDVKVVSLPQGLRNSAEKFGKASAISFGGREVSFKELDEASDRVATSLIERGIAKGDRIGLYCINCDEFVKAYFGILKAGATVVPVNLLLNPKEVAFILDNAAVSGLIFHAAMQPAVDAIASELPELKFSVRIGAPAGDGHEAFETLLQGGADCPALQFDCAEDVAVIIYTSGTTGYPKGAMLTHRNLYCNAWSIKEVLNLTPGADAVLMVLPLFHAFAGTAGMLHCILHGIRLVPLPRFDPAEVARTIAAQKCTVFMGVPSMYNLLLRLPKEHTAAVSSLKIAISGGASMPKEIMRAFHERFALNIHEGDGPTECGPATSMIPMGGPYKPASIGLCLPLVDMEIRDEEGKELPLGEIGEICVKGPNVMKGYWQLPEDTAEAFFGDWFRTGDLGSEDDDGFFYIVDRKKDMIIVNGMNVYPRMIEELLYKHPDVMEAAVVGEPNKLHGEVPIAYVALKDGAAEDAIALRNYCRDNLGRHQIPKQVVILPELPKNATGKIVKRTLRRQGEIERGIDHPAK